MKSVNNLVKKQDISLKNNYIKSLENDKFNYLIKKYDVPLELGQKYTSLLMDSAEEVYNCRKCDGLFECKNKVNGHCMVPIVSEKIINFSYDICKYAKEVKYRDNLTIFDVPKSIKEASMKNIFTNDKNRIPIIKELKNTITNLKNNNDSKGIYLHGNFGSGKTYLIAAAFNELAKHNIKSVIVHVPELLRSLKDSFSTNYSERFELLKKTPLLLLDDIGAEYLTEWGRDEVIEPILQYRMDEKLPTFFTSNFTLEELEKHFSITNNSIDKVKSKRIIERIKQISVDVELLSKNLRN